MNPLPCLTTCFFASLVSLGAHTCREVVRDSSGRVVQTIERRTGTGGTVHTVIRDASGRLAGTSTRWRRRVRHRLPRRERTALWVGDDTEQWIRILPNELP